MNIQGDLLSEIAEAFGNCFNHLIKKEDLSLQPTRKEFKGQYTFVTFPFLRITKSKPEDTGKVLGDYLMKNGNLVSDYNVVKGFLNLSIRPEIWKQLFLKGYKDEQFGKLPPKPRHFLIEYSSPNTNKPLHLGHLRNNFLGYATSQIYKAAGYNVTKVNLVNDRGIHICKSMLAYKKFGQGETPESTGIKGDHLVGNYYVKFDQEYKKEIQQLIAKGLSEKEAANEAPLIIEARKILKAWENNDTEIHALWKKMNQWVYDGFDVTYKRMGVDFDKTYYESETYLLGKAIVDEGLEKSIFYRKDDGSVWADLSDEGLDEKLLLRADQTSVYITQDLGTADLKYHDTHCDRSVYVVGNEQDYHFDVLFKLLKKLGRPYSDELYHLSYGMVDLPGGKMKSREGTVVDADDLIDEMIETARKHTEELGKIEGLSDKQANELYEILALGALKYFLLKVDPKKRMLFNPEESIQFHGNTGPFIQYTHARISALLRKANEEKLEFDNPEFDKLEELDESVISIIYMLNSYPQLVAEAAENYSPSQIAQFIYEVAKEYNRFYTEESIFKEPDEDKKLFKLAFSKQVSRTIRLAMDLLGIQVPERM